MICGQSKWLRISTRFVFVNPSAYKGNGFGRNNNMFGFYRNAQKAVKEYEEKSEKLDIIYFSSVQPLTLVVGLKLAKKYHVKCICEVRDR